MADFVWYYDSAMDITENELKIAIEATKEAGLILLRYYDTELTVETKENNTPVSNADYAANDFIIKKLSSHFPYPILSEESVDNKKRLRAKRTWIIDPLDGTKDFIEKTGEFSIAIGLVEDNQPILGVVYRPTTQELFYAQKGIGSFKETNGILQKLAVTRSDSVSAAEFAISKLDSKHSGYMDRMGAMNRTRIGSAAYKICKVAQGKYDAYFVIKSRMSEWDDCAAGLILTEAGGTLSDVFGDPLLYNQENVSRAKGVIASNKNLYRELLQKINPIASEEYNIT